MKKTRRSDLVIMGRMIGLVKPLAGHMMLAVVLGVLGYLCAASITVLGSAALLEAAKGNSPKTLFIMIAVFAIMRGILHYGEQNRNHFIAFTLLALIRDKVFTALRRLAPAKLDVKNKGELVSMITNDIELLEVFYAHTISPICIAVITCIVMLVFFASLNPAFAVVGLCAYIFVGFILPSIFSKIMNEDGVAFRENAGELSGYMLDTLRGLAETLSYGGTDKRREQMCERTDTLNAIQKSLKKKEGLSGAVTDAAVIGFSLIMLVVGLTLYNNGTVGFREVLLSFVGMFSSFGPVVALSALAGSLTHTLAAGERVLSLLEEEPEVKEIENGKNVVFENMKCEDVTFAYDKEVILNNFSMDILKSGITSIVGPSGSGKSTALKLLMRFRDVNGGKVTMSGENVKEINTKSLRSNQAYMTQDTVLFRDTIENNIKIADMSASREQVIEAAKKASVHDFIMTLPLDYDTNVGELGELLSSGERQRIGLARCFLSKAPLVLLDEPTSNLDTLNEGHILKTLDEARHEKSFVLVSHRPSAKGIADNSYLV